MRRPLLLLRTLITLLSLVLFIASITLWVRSRLRTDALYISGDEQLKAIANGNDGISCWSICCPRADRETSFDSSESRPIADFIGERHLGFAYVHENARPLEQGDLIAGLTIP